MYALANRQLSSSLAYFHRSGAAQRHLVSAGPGCRPRRHGVLTKTSQFVSITQQTLSVAGLVCSASSGNAPGFFEQFPNLPPPLQPELLFEAFLHLALLSLWGGVLYLSLSALVSFTTAKSGLAMATKAAAKAATTASTTQGPGLPALFLRGMAATCGVAISSTWKGIMALPILLVTRLGHALLVLVAGSLLHTN